MKARHATALAFLGWYLTLPLQARAKSSTLTLRQALLPVPNVMNESAYPAKFKPAPERRIAPLHFAARLGLAWLTGFRVRYLSTNTCRCANCQLPLSLRSSSR